MKLLYVFNERAPMIYRARMAYLVIIRQQTSCVSLLKIKNTTSGSTILTI